MLTRKEVIKRLKYANISEISRAIEESQPTISRVRTHGVCTVRVLEKLSNFYEKLEGENEESH